MAGPFPLCSGILSLYHHNPDVVQHQLRRPFYIYVIHTLFKDMERLFAGGNPLTYM